MKGHVLSNLTLRVQQLMPDLARNGVSLGTRTRHLRALRCFQEDLPLVLANLPLAEAAIRFFERRARDRLWRDTTLHREMANFTGACSNLPFYSPLPVGIDLNRDQRWAQAMKAAQKQARRDECRQQPAATPEEVDMAVRYCDEEPVAVALMVTWLFAGRVGDILQLETQYVKYHARTNELEATFYRGKGVDFNQPYTRKTNMPDEWKQRITRYLDVSRKRRDAPLFPKTVQNLGARVTEALRAANQNLGARAIRRGALQAMGANQVSLDIIQRFAGHARPETTLRYLGWSQYAEAEQVAGVRASEFLAPHRDAGRPSA